MSSDGESGKLLQDKVLVDRIGKTPTRRLFTTQEVENSIAFLRTNHAELIQILENVVAGKRVVIDILNDNEYYENDDYYRKMDDIFHALIKAHHANSVSQVADLFVLIRNELRKQNGIS